MRNVTDLIRVFEERERLCWHALCCGETAQRHKESKDVWNAIDILKQLERKKT